MSGTTFYRQDALELALQEQPAARYPWSLHDWWSDTRITFSGPELASLRDALNRLDLSAS